MVKDGAFVFEALAPGRYQLQVLGLARGEPRGHHPAVVEVTVGRESYIELDGSDSE